jgi:hypothetical protein
LVSDCAPDDPVPIVHSKEYRTLIVDGDEKYKNKLFEQTFQVGKSKWVKAFQLKEKAPCGRSITRIIYLDAPGGPDLIGHDATLTIDFTAGLRRRPGDDRDMLNSTQAGDIKRSFSDTTLSWTFTLSSSIWHLPTWQKEETHDWGFYK